MMNMPDDQPPQVPLDYATPRPRGSALKVWLLVLAIVTSVASLFFGLGGLAGGLWVSYTLLHIHESSGPRRP